MLTAKNTPRGGDGSGPDHRHHDLSARQGPSNNRTRAKQSVQEMKRAATNKKQRTVGNEKEEEEWEGCGGRQPSGRRGGEEKPITEPNDKRKMGKRGHVKEREQRVKGEERERRRRLQLLTREAD